MMRQVGQTWIAYSSRPPPRFLKKLAHFHYERILETEQLCLIHSNEVAIRSIREGPAPDVDVNSDLVWATAAGDQHAVGSAPLSLHRNKIAWAAPGQPPTVDPAVCIFVCASNSDSSVAAECIARHHFAQRGPPFLAGVTFFSAGTSPAPAIKPGLREVLARSGYALQDSPRPRSLEQLLETDLRGRRVDFVVTLHSDAVRCALLNTSSLTLSSRSPHECTGSLSSRSPQHLCSQYLHSHALLNTFTLTDMSRPPRAFLTRSSSSHALHTGGEEKPPSCAPHALHTPSCHAHRTPSTRAPHALAARFTRRGYHVCALTRLQKWPLRREVVSPRTWVVGRRARRGTPTPSGSGEGEW